MKKRRKRRKKEKKKKKDLNDLRNIEISCHRCKPPANLVRLVALCAVQSTGILL